MTSLDSVEGLMPGSQALSCLFATKGTRSQPAPGASGEFGSHAIRTRSSHHM